MSDAALQDLRFPIGPFEPPETIDAALRAAWIADLSRLPEDLARVLAPLDGDWLERPYRAGGWTVRQVVQHLADSHTNSLVRFKWALTEDRPLIKAYDEVAWAELPDVGRPDLEAVQAFLAALHGRWVVLLEGLSEDQWQRVWRHPESGDWRLDHTLGFYAWHGRHHLAHVTRLLEREGGPLPRR